MVIKVISFIEVDIVVWFLVFVYVCVRIRMCVYVCVCVRVCVFDFIYFFVRCLFTVKFRRDGSFGDDNL